MSAAGVTGDDVRLLAACWAAVRAGRQRMGQWRQAHQDQDTTAAALRAALDAAIGQPGRGPDGSVAVARVRGHQIGVTAGGLVGVGTLTGHGTPCVQWQWYGGVSRAERRRLEMEACTQRALQQAAASGLLGRHRLVSLRMRIGDANAATVDLAEDLLADAACQVARVAGRAGQEQVAEPWGAMASTLELDDDRVRAALAVTADAAGVDLPVDRADGSWQQWALGLGVLRSDEVAVLQTVERFGRAVQEVAPADTWATRVTRGHQARAQLEVLASRAVAAAGGRLVDLSLRVDDVRGAVVAQAALAADGQVLQWDARLGMGPTGAVGDIQPEPTQGRGRPWAREVLGAALGEVLEGERGLLEQVVVADGAADLMRQASRVGQLLGAQHRQMGEVLGHAAGLAGRSSAADLIALLLEDTGRPWAHSHAELVALVAATGADDPGRQGRQRTGRVTGGA